MLRILLLSAALLTGAAAEAQSRKPVVAVTKIDDLANTGQSENLTAMIETAIAATGKFRLFERQQLGKLVGEQARARGGMVTTNTPGRVGGFEGVDYLVYGSITSLSAKSEANIGSTLLAGFMSGSDRSRPSCQNLTATLAMDVKITDADSGEIKYVTRLMEKQKAAANCSGTSEIDKSALLRSAADKVATGLLTAINPIQIAAVQADGTLVLNYGEGAVSQGAVMAVFAKGESIRDPATGEVIGNDETRLGLIQVNSVLGRISKANTLGTFAYKPTVGAIVRGVTDQEAKAALKPARKK